MHKIFRTVFLGIIFGIASGLSAADLTLSNFVLVNKTHVAPATFDLTYQADITNSGAEQLTGVTATLVNPPPEVEVVDGELSFGEVGPGEMVTSTDTFVVRESRRVLRNEFPYDPNTLKWEISTSLPPVLESLVIEPAPLFFVTIDAQQQLTVTGLYSDGSTGDLTDAATGTAYQVADPDIAEVGADGLLTILDKGSTIFSASNAGMTAEAAIVVSPRDPVGQPLDFVPGEVLALLDFDVSADDIAARHSLDIIDQRTLKALGFTLVRFRVPAGRFEENLVSELRQDPDVASAGLNVISRPHVSYDDPYWTNDTTWTWWRRAAQSSAPIRSTFINPRRTQRPGTRSAGGPPKPLPMSPGWQRYSWRPIRI